LRHESKQEQIITSLRFRSGSRGNSVDVATRLLAGRSGFDFRQRLEFFSSPPRPDLLWGPTSLIPNEYQDPFSGLKRPGSEVDHSPPSSVEVKNAWSCTSTPQ